jgi:hypothetical protein
VHSSLRVTPATCCWCVSATLKVSPLISVRIPSEDTVITTINWSLAQPACPSWSSIRDESALRSAVASLEASGASLHWWLGFWTFLVAFGVTLEAVFVVWEYVEDLHDFRRGFVHAPEHPNRLLFVLGLAGAGLVAAGVSGELWKDSQIAKLETCIQQGNNTLFVLLSREAGDARKSADGAAASALTANAHADAANASAARAQDKATSVEQRANALNTQLDATETKRQEMEGAFINMAICNAPRVLPFWVIGGKSSFDSLTPLAPYKVVIEYVPNDAEAHRAALSIAGALEQSRWTVSPLIPIEGLNDGVEVQPFNGPSDGSMWGAHLRSSENAAVIVDLLHSYNWQAKVGFPLDEHGAMIYDPKVIPPDGLRITVGLYPAVSFVVPPGARDVVASVLQLRKEAEQRIKQAQKEYSDEEEKYLKTLTPEAQTEHKASQMESDARMKALTERYSNPCRPVNPLDPSFH